MLRINDFRKEITEEKFIEEMKRFPNNVAYIISEYAFPEWLMEKYADKLDWKAVSKYQIFSEGFARKFSDKLDLFEATSKNNDLDLVTVRWSDSFLREFYKSLNWFCLWENRSEEFLREFIPLVMSVKPQEVLWNRIIRTNTLREEFLREFVSRYHVNLSKSFTKKYFERLTI